MLPEVATIAVDINIPAVAILVQWHGIQRIVTAKRILSVKKVLMNWGFTT